jgi:hypothetical protein
MNAEDRRNSMLFHEGQVIQSAGHHGSDHAAHMARAVVDGVMNALIRLDGAEETAKYAFALADRVVGRLKEPTALAFMQKQPTLVATPIDIEADLKNFAAGLQRRQPTLMRFGWLFCGFVCGFVAALVLVIVVGKHR